MTGTPLSGVPGGTYAFSPSSSPPFLYWTGSGGQPPSTEPAIALLFDDVFATPPAKGTSLSWDGLFTLSPGSDAVFPYVITAEPAIWTFDGSVIRASVQKAFDDMLSGLDDPGADQPIALKGGRSWLIRSHLSQALPLTFAETLYVRYGFDPANRRVDVLPGMRLRIDFQSHQPIDPEASLLNGFVGSGRAYVDVTQRPSGGSAAVAFDPFLTALEGLTVPVPSGGGAGALDLQGSSNAFPYWRLVYPAQFPSSDSPGVVGPAGNAALIGAPTYGDLQTATAAYQSGDAVSAPAAAIYFRGRVAIVPEIPILVQGVYRHVPIGTTARDVVSGQFPLPWLENGAVPNSPTQFLVRPITLLYESQSAPRWNYQSLAVSTFYTQWGDYLDSIDVPLLGGDALLTFVQQSSS